MNRLVSLLIFCCLPVLSFGQCLLDDLIEFISFEDTTKYCMFNIDTVADTNNIWQIGEPNKTVFTSAFSTSNVIVTDTTQPYPINDTSSFTVMHLASSGLELSVVASISGYYYVNSDTITDYGLIEFSADNGLTWIDLLNDTAYAPYIHMFPWGGDTLVLSGNSGGWKRFGISFAALGPLLGVRFGDTILYRFTFISDSVQTNKDGLMFDDLRFDDWAESVDEIKSNKLISIFPSPTHDRLYIQPQPDHLNRQASVKVLDVSGRLLYSNDNFTGTYIDVGNYINGVYCLYYSNGTAYTIKNFVVTH